MVDINFNLMKAGRVVFCLKDATFRAASGNACFACKSVIKQSYWNFRILARLWNVSNYKACSVVYRIKFLKVSIFFWYVTGFFNIYLQKLNRSNISFDFVTCSLHRKKRLKKYSFASVEHQCLVFWFVLYVLLEFELIDLISMRQYVVLKKIC